MLTLNGLENFIQEKTCKSSQPNAKRVVVNILLLKGGFMDQLDLEAARIIYL